MRDDVIHTFAQQFHVPEPDVRQLAASVAERCALISNRFAPRGELGQVDARTLETLGAVIGAAIMAEFPAHEPTTEEQEVGSDDIRARIAASRSWSG